MTTECLIFRCSRQPEMYLYVRADLTHTELPEPLLQRAGRLTEVMRLQLTPERRLARADVVRVIERLQVDGWYLQMPPEGLIHGHLDDGD
jgi:uncharacterized protein YcgL (UPF0745 family)